MFTDIDETVKAAAIQIRLFKWDIWLTTSEQLDISELGKWAKRETDGLRLEQESKAENKTSSSWE